MAHIVSVIFFVQMIMMCKTQSHMMMTQWTIPEWKFNYTDQNSLLVFDNITRDIWIMGGLHHRKTLYKYNIDKQMVTDTTSTVNQTETIFGWNYLNGRNTVLINRTVYFVSHIYRKIHTFNIETLEYNDDIGVDNGKWNPCMVTNVEQTRLYIAAGWNSKTFFIWDLQTATEIKGAPDHNEDHTGGACHMIDNILYIMSGVNSTLIEYIDLNALNNDITNTKWNIVEQQFPSVLYSPASAVCDNLIFIMGGALPSQTANHYRMRNSVFVFDISTNDITQQQSLPVDIAWSPAICVEKRIYIFMGLWVDEFGRSLRSTCMYSDLWFIPTQQPTNEPTKNPTQQPTNEPTKNPTQQPTIEQTKGLTNNPSHDQQPIQYGMAMINSFVLKSIIVVFSIFSLLCIVDYLHSKCSYKYRWGVR
eukprot:166694_1